MKKKKQSGSYLEQIFAGAEISTKIQRQLFLS